MLEFLKSWRKWVDEGAPEGAPYSRDEGLCIAIYDYCRQQYSDGIRRRIRYVELDTLVENALINTYGRGSYPFGGRTRYGQDSRNKVMHLNELRLAWVDKQLAGERNG